MAGIQPQVPTPHNFPTLTISEPFWGKVAALGPTGTLRLEFSSLQDLKALAGGFGETAGRSNRSCLRSSQEAGRGNSHGRHHRAKQRPDGVKGHRQEAFIGTRCTSACQ